jgi:hypothetical protein
VFEFSTRAAADAQDVVVELLRDGVVTQRATLVPFRSCSYFLHAYTARDDHALIEEQVEVNLYTDAMLDAMADGVVMLDGPLLRCVMADGIMFITNGGGVTGTWVGWG